MGEGDVDWRVGIFIWDCAPGAKGRREPLLTGDLESRPHGGKASGFTRDGSRAAVSPSVLDHSSFRWRSPRKRTATLAWEALE